MLHKLPKRIHIESIFKVGEGGDSHVVKKSPAVRILSLFLKCEGTQAFWFLCLWSKHYILMTYGHKDL